MSLTSSILFRKATSSDAVQLSKMLNQLSDQDKRFFSPHAFDVQTLRELCSNTHDFYFVLVKNNQVIGYSMLRCFRTDTPTFGCCIHPDHRGNGYSSILMQETLAAAKHYGFSKVILHVHTDNTVAYHLYEQHGFTPVCTQVRMEKTV